MRRFSTEHRAENYRTFEDPSRWTAASTTQAETDALGVMQWENKKAVKRTKVHLPVTP